MFAAGDVAEYPDRILGRRRIEHVDNAEQMGRQAGRNLTGADEDYAHTPYYTRRLDTRYEAVGTRRA
jgi:NADPH-dependent 2,4-dienoyl-CoA reductase/sulfur reductase-like enzyme